MQESNETDWSVGVTLKRTANGGATWTIAVPADGEDHKERLDAAVSQALDVWRGLEDAFPAEEGTHRRSSVARISR
jgi:hypothetical protein